MRYLIVLLILLIPILAGAESVTLDYTYCEDTYIQNNYGNNQDDNHGTATILYTKRTDETSGDRKALLVKFDLSSISGPVTVDSVDFAIMSYYTLSVTTSICKMLTDWEEGNCDGAVDAEGEYGATWNYANDDYDDDADPPCVDMNWDSGDFGTGDYDDNSGSYYDTRTSDASDNYFMMHYSGDDVEDLVEGWINGTYSNYGFMIYGGATQAAFCSSEYGTSDWRPSLYIEYTETSTDVPQIIMIEAR